MNITLYGPEAGNNLQFVCDEGDMCYIDCIGDKSCNITGCCKCFITCDGNIKNKDCVNIGRSVLDDKIRRQIHGLG